MILYNFTYNLLRLILRILSPLLGKKTKSWVALRDNQNIFNAAFPQNNLRIWVHASSGEIEYAKGFIREFKKSYPQSQIFVSYSSVSAPALFKNIQDEVTAFFPLNWDTTHDNRRLLDFINPSLIIFSRTDFWPNFIHQAQLNNIKLAAIAANPSISFLNSFLLKLICRKFTFISCVEPEQVLYLQNLLPQTHIEYIPDTRFDQVFFRLSQNPTININHSKSLMTFGSTWPKDDNILIEAAPYLLQDCALVWAPHDVKHAIELKKILAKHFPNKNILLFAEYQPESHFDILIVDRIGVLADFYRYSSISFVGGSFVGRVHSVMEPLCAGNFVIVGPYHHNNPEALNFKKYGFVKSVTNAQEFVASAHHFRANQHRRTDLVKMTDRQKGGSVKTVQAVTAFLKA